MATSTAARATDTVRIRPSPARAGRPRPATAAQTCSPRLGRRARVGVETIRFYEREGLLAEPARLASGYRQYPPQAAERVGFIRQAQRLDFTLREVKELLALRDDPDASRADVREKAVAKLADIEAKIRELEAMRADLGRLVAACDGDGPAAGCPIIAAIGGEGPDRPSVEGMPPGVTSRLVRASNGRAGPKDSLRG